MSNMSCRVNLESGSNNVEKYFIFYVNEFIWLFLQSLILFTVYCLWKIHNLDRSAYHSLIGDVV